MHAANRFPRTVVSIATTPRRSPGRWTGWIARGLAFSIAAFALLNLLAGLRSPTFDANLWWIDLRFLPPVLATAVLLPTATALLAFAVWPPRSTWQSWLTWLSSIILGTVALVDCGRFYLLWARGGIAPGIPVPVSALACAALFCIAGVAARMPRAARRALDLAPVLGVAAACGLLFPLLQMVCFGKTDYRRPADAAVIFGARAYADGRPSDALADRVRTGCELYRKGLVGKLIFSGGPGDGPVHETESMQKMAIQLGVRPQDILLDKDGLNTLATVRNTESLFAQSGARRVLVVSHFYHLPRIKLTYQREGMEVYTVPAKESYLLRQLPYNMLREVAALWLYYSRPLFVPRSINHVHHVA